MTKDELSTRLTKWVRNNDKFKTHSKEQKNEILKLDKDAIFKDNDTFDVQTSNETVEMQIHINFYKAYSKLVVVVKDEIKNLQEIESKL